jgi:hypothetical protein
MISSLATALNQEEEEEVVVLEPSNFHRTTID